MKKKNKQRKSGPVRAIDLFYSVLPLLSIALLILLWYWISNTRPDLFPTMSATWQRFMAMQNKPIMRLPLIGHIWVSLRRVLLGLAISLVLGISFGVLIGWNKKLDKLLGTVYFMIRPIPPLAWIPLITVWFGIGEGPKIGIIVIGSLASVVINTYTGMKNVDMMYLNVGRVFNANTLQMFFEIAIPSALPSIFAGIKTALSAAWMVVLAAEMIGANSGVGFLVVRGMDSYDMPLVLVAMVTIGIVGALLSAVVNFLERSLCPWIGKQ